MFNLSQKSISKLRGVNNRLVAVVHDAIKISHVDFTVGEGLRTLDRQRELVRTGKSRTLNSKHLTGDAVDLWAFIKGKVNWGDDDDIEYYYDIAQAMRDSAIKNDLVLRWGAVWDKSLNDIKDTHIEPILYSRRRKALGKKAFIDAFHFEIK